MIRFIIAKTLTISVKSRHINVTKTIASNYDIIHCFRNLFGKHLLNHIIRTTIISLVKAFIGSTKYLIVDKNRLVCSRSLRHRNRNYSFTPR